MTERRLPISANPRFLWTTTAVLLLAALFRLIALQDVPPGLSQDEVLNADIVSFIRGGYHAVFFREGYGHEPLYHYWAVPFQTLLGDNVFSIRLPAVVLGLFLVALTMRWAKREFGSLTAVVAGLLLAVSWWPIIFSRIGIRPILEPVLLLLMAWFWPKRPLLAGLFLGLSLYSYTGARVMLALPVLLGVYEGIVFLWGRIQYKELDAQSDKERFRNSIWAAGKMLATAVVVTVPLFYVLQADPTLQQRVDQLSGPLDALQQGDFGPIWQSVSNTLGVFSFTGDPRWTYTLPERPLFDWVTAVLFYAGLGLALWRIKQPRYAFLLIWLAVGLVPSAVTPQSPSTIRMIGALPVVYVLPGLAVTSLQRIRIVNSKQYTVYSKGLLYTALSLLFAIFLINVGRTVRDGFIRWPQAEETRLNHYQTVLLEMSRYYRGGPLVIADGFYEPIDRDSFRRNLGAYAPTRWVQTGANVAGAVVIPVDEGAGNGRLYVPEFAAISPDLLAAAGISPEPIYRSDGWPSFAVYTLTVAEGLADISPITTFDDSLVLIDYELLPRTPEENLVVLTTWRVKRPLPDSLVSFIHLLNKEGEIMAQHDGWDAAAMTLQSGDVVVQRHFLPWPKNLPSGEYTIQLGLYNRENGQRWPLDTSPMDTILLDEFSIDGN